MKKKKLVNLILGFLGGVLIGATVAYLIAFVLVDPKAEVSQPLYYKLLLVPIAVLSLWVVIVIHELGHILAGFTQQFEFRFISAGPVMVEKELGRLRLKKNTNFNTFGGVALCLPIGQDKLRKRFAVFAAGGPLASLVFGCVLVLAFFFLSFDKSILSDYLMESFLLISCTLSFCIGLVTIIPMHSEGFTSDGGRILNLLRGGYAGEIESALLVAITQATSGIRPSLIDPHPLIEAVNFPIESPMKPYLHGFLYNHFQDLGDLEKAGRYLDDYLGGIDYIPKGYQASVHLEKAWFEAFHHGNVAPGKEVLANEKFGVMVPKSQVLRVEAAIAFVEGNRILASSKAKEAIKELPKLVDKGAAIAEKEWLETIIQSCEDAQR